MSAIHFALLVGEPQTRRVFERLGFEACLEILRLGIRQGDLKAFL